MSSANADRQAGQSLGPPADHQDAQRLGQHVEQTLDHAGLMQTLLAEMTRMTGLSVLFSHAVAARVGLNPTDLEALEILMREGSLPAGRLAETTGLTTGAITGVVDRLERRGYARRRPDPDDRRRVIIEVENEAVSRDLLPRYAGMHQAVSRLVAGLDDRDLALFLRFIQDANAIAADQIAHLRAQPTPDEPSREPVMNFVHWEDER